MKFSRLIPLVLVASTQAWAVSIPGWERPVYQADMKVLDVKGPVREPKTVELVMTKEDGSRTPTGLELTMDGRKVFFPIVATRNLGCGSVEYFAEVARMAGPRPVRNYGITLADHTKRICEDARRYMWEVEYTVDGDFLSGMIRMGGNPEGVVTVQ
jgi:hypothetical protein